jgi:polyisoprenyl-teichoic acid--peptidoglycan teichoic acid transferase
MEKLKNLFSKENLKKYATKQKTILAVILLVLLIQIIRTELALSQYRVLAQRDSSLVTEIGQIKGSYGLIGDNINEVREFLRLPKESFAAFDDTEEVEEDGQNGTQLALFQYVDYLAASKRIDERLAKNTGFIDGLMASEALLGAVADQGLNMSGLQEDGEASTINIGTKDKQGLIAISLSKDNGKLFLTTSLGEEELVAMNLEELENELTAFITKHTRQILDGEAGLEAKRVELLAAFATAEVLAVLEERNIKIELNFPTQSGNKLIYAVSNKVSEVIAEVQLNTIDLEVKLEDLRNTDNSVMVTEMATQLPFFLGQLDTQTYIERKASEALENVKSTFADEGFQLLLSENGLNIGSTIREDDERYYFDLFDGETRVSSIVVEKATGVVNIVDANGAQSQNILFFDPSFKKKTLEIPENIPNYSTELVDDDDTFTVLIAGKHGALVDTMIVAHIDDERQDVRMVSIPRDLQYNGRKINSYPHYYGMEELVKVLKEVTGYEIDRYILIDMYAFIDVIDLIGGIDVSLEQAVIDPFYRTVDNGVVGTLHYEPGDYHLGGVEALRLARSRKTSSDFARAERQQMILEAIQEKARNFGFGDADTLYLIARTVLDKTETNIGFDEAIGYYFRYQNYKIKSNDVMSSGNILYVPPYVKKEDCVAREGEIDAISGQPVKLPALCAAGAHAYTLLPKDDDWNVIKWFFREKFE